MIDLSVNLPGLKMKNPLMPASGSFGFGDSPQAQKMDLNQLGALVLKTTTPTARTGNPQPQIVKLEHGMLNAVGLTNPGVDQVVKEKLPALRRRYPELPIVASVGAADLDGYLLVAQKLAQTGMINALELNLSCPNVARGGMSLGVHPDLVAQVTQLVKTAVSIPVYVKLTPNVTSIGLLARAAATAGADGLSLINTVYGLAIDLKQKRPRLGNNFGGYSGPAVKPIALAAVAQVRQVTDLPIIGMSGIANAKDAAEFLLAGANALAVGSAQFADAEVINKIATALPEQLQELGVSRVQDLVGQLKFN
jgi:dihydroorotate dehydrogenase (fumarate)